MECFSGISWLSLIVLAFLVMVSGANTRNEKGVKTQVFLSPKIEMEPGSVVVRVFPNVDFPKGHIAVKRYSAELVDGAGNSVPLHEAYIHHWILFRYFHPKKVEGQYRLFKKKGICGDELAQSFGLGSETRRTDVYVPDPFGIEVGNPEEIPDGFEDGWMLNLHVADTRGAEDKLGCAECRCDLFNVTKDEYGIVLEADYLGGMRCCYAGTKCRVKEGVQDVKRSLSLKYTVTYVDWDSSILPAKIYILDVTATMNKKSDGSIEPTGYHCQGEYQIESCPATSAPDQCIHTKTASMVLPTGGEVVYAVAHQHTGGLGSTLARQDGGVICSSYPTYGKGLEAGNEAGYVVGMSVCYPQPGSIRIADGESLTIVSNYSNLRSHTGIMGQFYLLIAEPTPSKHKQKKMLPVYVLVAVVFGVGVVVAVVNAYKRRCRIAGYDSVST